MNPEHGMALFFVCVVLFCTIPWWYGRLVIWLDAMRTKRMERLIKRKVHTAHDASDFIKDILDPKRMVSPTIKPTPKVKSHFNDELVDGPQVTITNHTGGTTITQTFRPEVYSHKVLTRKWGSKVRLTSKPRNEASPM